MPGGGEGSATRSPLAISTARMAFAIFGIIVTHSNRTLASSESRHARFYPGDSSTRPRWLPVVLLRRCLNPSFVVAVSDSRILVSPLAGMLEPGVRICGAFAFQVPLFYILALAASHDARRTATSQRTLQG